MNTPHQNARATVAFWLRQAGIGRLEALEPKEPPRRYQRERQGELIHIDIEKLGRFERIGHRITGNRTGQNKSRGVGWDFVHVAVDDATRLVYVEVLPDKRRGSATGFLLRALRWFRRGASASSASSRRLCANGPMRSSTRHQASEQPIS